MYPHVVLLLTFMVLCSLRGHSQDSISVVSKILSLPDKVFSRIDKESFRLEKKIASGTDKYLNKLENRELRLYKKMWRQDSTKAKEIFGDIKGRYADLRTEVHSTQKGITTPGTPYLGKLDSLTTTFKFLQQDPSLRQATELAGKLGSNMQHLKGLQQNLNAAELLKNKIKERQDLLKEQLQNTPLARQLKNFCKDVYYYQQQVNTYRETLNDPQKLGTRLLQTAQKIPAFQDFFSKHSQFAGMFRLPGGDDAVNTPSLAGLQTRADVQNLFQQQFGYSPAIGQQMRQSLQSGQDQLQQLKKIAQQNISKGGTGNEELDFKPNNQRTKSFKERLQLGANVQSQKPNSWFPVTSDLGLSIGYKLNDKSTIGTGVSYKLGWGQNIQHIKISHQGMGIRNFIDWKLKGSFWLSGGFEMNFRSEIKNIDELKDRSAWQQSGLVGLSKVISMKTKFFERTTLQLMWDFLSYQQLPRTQPIIFRTGYNIR